MHDLSYLVESGALSLHYSIILQQFVLAKLFQLLYNFNKRVSRGEFSYSGLCVPGALHRITRHSLPIDGEPFFEPTNYLVKYHEQDTEMEWLQNNLPFWKLRADVRSFYCVVGATL